MESSPTVARVGLALQLAACACALAGVVALSMWFVPVLAQMYAGAGLTLRAPLRFLIGASRFWWLIALAVLALLILLGRGAAASVAAERRSVAIAAFTFAAVVYLAVYALSVTLEYSRTIDLAATHMTELRHRIAADSARAAAAADTSSRR